MMGRYPIDGYEGDDKYQIVFTKPSKDDLVARAMEGSPEFREMLLRHHSEASELSRLHSREQVLFILDWDKKQKAAAAEAAQEGSEG